MEKNGYSYLGLIGFGETGPIRPRGRRRAPAEKHRHDIITRVEEDDDRREQDAEDDAEDSNDFSLNGDEGVNTTDELRASMPGFAEFEENGRHPSLNEDLGLKTRANSYYRTIDDKKKSVSNRVELNPKRLLDVHGHELPPGTIRSVPNFLADYTQWQGVKFTGEDGPLRHKIFNVFEQNTLEGHEVSHLKVQRNFKKIGDITNKKIWKSNRKWGERKGAPTPDDLKNLHTSLFNSKNLMYLVPILTKLHAKYPDKIRLSEIDDFVSFAIDENLKKAEKSREDIPVYFEHKQSWAMLEANIPEIEYQGEVDKEDGSKHEDRQPDEEPEIEPNPKRLKDVHGNELPPTTIRSTENLLADFILSESKNFEGRDPAMDKFYDVFKRNALEGHELSDMEQPIKFRKIAFITDEQDWHFKKKWGKDVGKATYVQLTNLHTSLFTQKNILYLHPTLTKLHQEYPDKFPLSHMEKFVLFCLTKTLRQMGKSPEDVPVYHKDRVRWEMVPLPHKVEESIPGEMGKLTNPAEFDEKAEEFQKTLKKVEEQTSVPKNSDPEDEELGLHSKIFEGIMMHQNNQDAEDELGFGYEFLTESTIHENPTAGTNLKRKHSTGDESSKTSEDIETQNQDSGDKSGTFFETHDELNDQSVIENPRMDPPKQISRVKFLAYTKRYFAY